MATNSGYSELLPNLQGSRPLLAQALILAERRRSERLAKLFEGARLRGLEQLFTYLRAAEKAYAETPTISGVAFLIERIRADYQTALEATLSGYQGVAADAMRDVMEIEYLLLDFAADPGSVDEWLNADDRLMRSRYRPVKVRERLRDHGVGPFANDDFEPIDYKAHSESLHVNPRRSPVAARGPEPLSDPVPFYGDFGFIEMFEHGRRILMAIEILRVVAMGLPDDYDPLTPRDEFDDAHARTHQMQLMMVGFIQGPAVLRERLGREPTSADLLRYVAGEVATESEPFGTPGEGSNWEATPP
ncbi:hypothetical protein [Nocardia sp. NPDC059195]|uniref:hypothetical protein n=1 Tax=Nocardia sp. NPDC059195 TaxID=3346765 RepID=UPI0036B78CB6